MLTVESHVANCIRISAYGGNDVALPKNKGRLISYRRRTKFSVSALIDLMIGVTVEWALPRRISPLT